MCELFGMSSRVKAAVSLSLDKLAQHGSADGPNHDGWGVAYYQGHDARIIKEAGCANESPLMRFVEDAQTSSKTVIAHIRHATTGGISLENTHPFTRELGGHAHVFAHNGEVPGIFDLPSLRPQRSRPIGTTDSEYAFCALLARLSPLWLKQDPPSLEARLKVIETFAAELAEVGAANFLYADGITLFAHSHRRRSQPGAPFQSPGLHALVRSCPSEPSLMEAAGVSMTSREGAQEVTLLTSVPLTQEAWRPLPEGTVLALERGQIVAETKARN